MKRNKLTDLSFSEKCSWAKKAASLNTETKSGQVAFYKMTKESGIRKMWLTYYSNAYEAAGESGMRVLSYRKKMPDKIRKKAMKVINAYLHNRVPKDLRREIGFLVKAQYNRITASEKRPLFSKPSQTSCIEIFQVRYTDFDNRWHLYWMRKFHKWWPYIPQEPIYTIQDCLEEVKADAWGCFWG